VKTLLTLTLLAFSLALRAATPSALWGEHGEKWTSQSRLPDFSHAGYRCGEAPLPAPTAVTDVKKFGALGDGTTDDTAAFRRAIAGTDRGVIFIPEGRYVITESIVIAKSGLVLRGAGIGQTVLVIPRSLEQIHGAKTTAEGTKSSWAFQGGIIEVHGKDTGRKLTVVAAPAKRGDNLLALKDVSALTPGAWIRLLMNDDATLGRHLHGDLQDVAPTTQKEMKHLCDWVARVTSIDGNTIVLDRPLRLDVRPEWEAEIWSWQPTVEEVGIESLTFEFPGTPKKKHLQEEGFNALDLRGVANSWVRNIEVIDADNGLILGGSRFCTVEGFTARAVKRTSAETGHHTLWATGKSQDNLFTGFKITTIYVHELTVEGCSSGNVFERGSGVSLALDHHSNAPYENLFTELDAGAPKRLWICGGREDRGPHTAARTTLWNLAYANSEKLPTVPSWPQINVIGVPGCIASTTPDHEWIEPCEGGVTPTNLYRAQLARRLDREKPAQP
jgi:hypothetical protein